MVEWISVEKKYWRVIIISTGIFYLLAFEIAGVELFSGAGILIALGGIIMSTGGFYCGKFYDSPKEGKQNG